MLNKFGLTESDLPNQAPELIQGQTLIMDGDGACYASTYDAKKLETAVRRFHTNVEEKMILTSCSSARVHITPKGCLKNYRDYLLSAKPYQGNRLNKEKPPLLEVLRSMLASHFADHEYIKVFAHMDKEADDAIMQDCYSIPNTVTYSEDKDLTIVPTPFFDHYTGTVSYIISRYGKIKLDLEKDKVVGRGTKFFWAQMLMGDSADNVKGIKTYNAKLCGVKAAYSILDKIEDESHAANIVLDGYRAINQNPIPEAECLWLHRVAGDSARAYINSLNLSEANREFMLQQEQRKWYMQKDEYEEWCRIFNECNSTKEVQARWEAWLKILNA